MNSVPVKISSGISVKEEDFDRANGTSQKVGD
jgi:hypothetical protein